MIGNLRKYGYSRGVTSATQYQKSHTIVTVVNGPMLTFGESVKNVALKLKNTSLSHQKLMGAKEQFHDEILKIGKFCIDQGYKIEIAIRCANAYSIETNGTYLTYDQQEALRKQLTE